ncbi:MAG: 30S ribosomal protein S6 [Alphaproteobacteria bacterium]
MAIYETVFILRQDLTVQQVDELSKNFKKIITDGNGKLLKEENWGLRTLAYKIKKNKKGHYVLFETEAPATAIAEFERKMGINENVLRFMTIKLAKPSEGPSAILSQKDFKDERK